MKQERNGIGWGEEKRGIGWKGVNGRDWWSRLGGPPDLVYVCMYTVHSMNTMHKQLIYVHNCTQYMHMYMYVEVLKYVHSHANMCMNVVPGT